MNIVSMAMKFVGPAVIDRIARSLGINSTLARTAVATALPAIMAALSGKGSTASGAGSVLNMIRGKGASGLENLESMLGGADEARHIENGRRELESVLGGGEMGPIMQAVSRFTGIEEEKSSALFGMMGPVALGALGEEQTRQNLDANGLSRFLAGQQQNIAEALPNGFADHVSGSSTFDSFRTNLMASETAAVAHGDPVDAPRADHAEPVRRVEPEPVRKSGGMLWPLLGLLALLAAGWWLWNNVMAPNADLDPAAIEQSLGQSEIGSQLTGTVGTLNESLGSITDEASARAALPDLTSANESLGGIQDMYGNLPEAQQGAFASMVAKALETLEPAIEKVRAIPGVGPVVGPVLDEIVAKMQALA